MYTLPSPVTRSLMAARERNVVFVFWRGLISDVWFRKPVVQFHALNTRELRSGTAKRIRLVKGVSCTHSGSVSVVYRGWLSWATTARGACGSTVRPVAELPS